MLTVIIPTLNSERTLPRTLACLVGPTVRGLVREVILADGGSTDGTSTIADETGARLVSAARPPGRQMRAGAGAARSDWLLFLPPDTVLEPAWADEAASFFDRCERAGGRALEQAGVFRFALDDFDGRARRVESMAALRSRFFGLPHSAQGLIIHKNFYDKLGGHADLPALEDADIARRIGRKRLAFFRTGAVTSAERHRKSGFFLRPVFNFACLSLCAVGVPPRMLFRLYS